MKKFLFTALMVVMGVCAQAQIVSSSSSRVVRVVEKPVVEEKPVEPVTPFDVSHYVKLDVGILGTYMPTSDYRDLLNPSDDGYGWSLMYGMDIPFWQKEAGGGYSCLYWGFEAGMTTRSFAIDGSHFDYLSEWEGNKWPDYDKFKRLGLQVAPKIGFKWGVNSKDATGGLRSVGWGIELGLYANYNVKSSYLLTDNKYGKEGILPATSELLMSAFIDAWNDFDTGIFVETFFIIGHIRWGVGYVGGLTPSFSGVDCKPVEGYYLPPVSATYGSGFMSFGVEF